jgi:hypothetical protein
MAGFRCRRDRAAHVSRLLRPGVGSDASAWAEGYEALMRVAVRMTAVLHQDDGEWKAVQTHASIGVPNDRVLDPMFAAR